MSSNLRKAHIDNVGETIIEATIEENREIIVAHWITFFNAK